MAGRGRLGEVPSLSDRRLFMFREGGWTAAAEPLHMDKPEIAGIGLGMRFAVELMNVSGMAPIGLVPCAVGGTPLRRWMPGADLYVNAVNTLRSALGNGKLSGVLWHQGEADSGSFDDAASYGERFRKMIECLRSDFAAEGAPVLAGQLGSFLRNREGCVFFERVNEQMRALEGKLPTYTWVSAKGLTDNGDSLHFNATSLREFGTRYAAGYLALIEKTRSI